MKNFVRTSANLSGFVFDVFASVEDLGPWVKKNYCVNNGNFEEPSKTNKVNKLEKFEIDFIVIINLDIAAVETVLCSAV